MEIELTAEAKSYVLKRKLKAITVDVHTHAS